MEEKDHMLLCEGIINIFGDALRSIFKREACDKKYMRQTILGSRFRAFVAILTAVVQSFGSMVKVLALAIAKHRFEHHNEKTIKTQESLKRSMTSSEIETATQAGWVN